MKSYILITLIFTMSAVINYFIGDYRIFNWSLGVITGYLIIYVGVTTRKL